MKVLTAVLTSASALMIAACDFSGSAGSVGPCAGDSPAPGCGQACTADTECESGFHCADDGQCTAECSPDGEGCGADEACNPDGTCVPVTEPGPDPDGGDGCPDINVALEPITPTVVILLDGSSSMTDDKSQFGMFDTRWEAVQDALSNDETGVLWSLEHNLILGASIYSSDNGNENGATCPVLQEVAAALDNAQEVTDLLSDNVPPGNEGLDTPTAESIVALTASFPAGDKRVLVLATDGYPDTCDDPDSNDKDEPRQASEEAVMAAYAAGISTYVLSVGTDVTGPHLDRMARAGVGQDLQSGAAAAYIATDPEELTAAFEDIIRGTRTCEIEVDGTVNLEHASEGEVTLNGNPLEYEVDWKMLDPDTMELLGDACDTFLNTDEVTLTANFPCGGVVVD